MGGTRVVVDQCRFGLKAPGSSGKLVKKATTFLTNSPMLVQHFSNKRCEGGHEHQRVQGSEGGVRRSRASQVYPELLCKAIADSVEAQWKRDNPNA